MKLLSLLALVASFSFGQSGGTGTVHSDSSWAGLTTSNAISTSGTLTINGSSTLFASSPTFTTWNGIPVESRKLDKPGPTIAQVKQAAWIVPASRIASPQYLKIAKVIGLDSAAIEESNLLQALKDRDIKVYDFDKVDNYLYRQALKQGANYRWVWKPVRGADMKQFASATEGMAASYQDIAGMGFIHPKLYDKAIPERVLELMGCLLEDVKEAIYLASDYEVVHPDPFLAITTPKLLAAHKVFIVEQWNEPGFDDGQVNTAKISVIAKR